MTVQTQTNPNTLLTATLNATLSTILSTTLNTTRTLGLGALAALFILIRLWRWKPRVNRHRDTRRYPDRRAYRRFGG